MKQAISHLLLIGTLLIAACGGRTAFEDFSSEAGQFSIAVPTTFQETEQSVETPVGPINIHTFTTEDENSAYVVAYSDYPVEIVQQSDPQMLLDSSRDGALTNLNGTIVSEEPIDLNGNPGRSLIIGATNPGGDKAVINSRMYLVGNRLYQLLVVTPEGQASDRGVNTFLESFTLQ